MLTFVLSISLLSCLCLLEAQNPIDCSPNEQYDECGSACGNICHPPVDLICPRVCYEGCFCMPGMVRHERHCIPLEDCPPPDMTEDCPTGMEFRSCGTACPLTCDQRTPGECTRQCVEGCFCPSGTVLHEGECINVDRCPEEECPEGMLFNECGSACPATCDSTPEFCTLQCVSGCFCAPGTVLHEGNCIDLLECPLDCPAGMEFRSCGTACPPTCDEPNPTECTEQCVRGCFCPSGTILHEGECITVDRCPEEAPPTEESTSECLLNCQNGGRCATGIGAPFCRCKRGYRGRLCENISTATRPVPTCRLACQNGGTCTSAFFGFAYCACMKGYSGRFCENTVHNPNPSRECRLACQNGGTCATTGGTAHCRCSSGYKGRFCEETKPKPECYMACQNGGTCASPTGDDSYCICLSGYTGEFCENAPFRPAPRPVCPLDCQNGGRCSTGIGEPFCRCKSGYAGRLCENASTTMSPKPVCRLECQNNGTCIRGRIGFSYCKCRKGYAGRLCESTLASLIRGCDLTCQNGGTCVTRGEMSYCRCRRGRKGRFCQINVSETPETDGNPTRAEES